MKPFLNIYRIQLSKAFTFSKVESYLSYFANLGVDALYFSPIFQARENSSHGYDTVDFRVISEDLGGLEGLKRLQKKASDNGLSILLDYVANHMSASFDNPFWRDVLKQGASSPYAEYFDIDFEKYGGKICLPILPKPLKEFFDQKEIQLGDKGIYIGDNLFPLRDDTMISEDIKKVLDQQAYIPIYWKEANGKVNYRRFFDINDLVALNMKSQKLFKSFHEPIKKLLDKGIIQGLRVDHPDGLYDPKKYLSEIKGCLGASYVALEKILEKDEPLNKTWDCIGTVGYEYLNAHTHLFLDARAKDSFNKIYDQILKGNDIKSLFDEKLAVIKTHFLSEINTLARLYRLNDQTLTLKQLEIILPIFLASFDVYRTYITPGDQNPADIKRFEKALSRTRDKLAIAKNFEPIKLDTQAKFIERLQQITPSIMAKSFEDTYLYNHNLLLAMNEVGGFKNCFGITSREYHQLIQEKLKNWPYSWIGSSTHDTKRSEGVRLRLATLTELSVEYKEFLERAFYVVKQLDPEKRLTISKNVQLFIYQTILGFWEENKELTSHGELFERLESYLIKASRESKVFTNWYQPNLNYEHSLILFAKTILDNEDFKQAFEKLFRALCPLGNKKILAVTAWKCGLPGALDIYQGSELVDYLLVDPDNRRAVNFVKCKEMLSRLKDRRYEELKTYDLKKLYLLKEAFPLRKQLKQLIFEGSYKPINFDSDNYIGYLRTLNSQKLLIVVKRLQKESLKPKVTDANELLGNYQCLLTGKRVTMQTTEDINKAFDCDFVIYYSLGDSSTL